MENTTFTLLCRKSKEDRILQTFHREKIFSRILKFKKKIMETIIRVDYIYSVKTCTTS